KMHMAVGESWQYQSALCVNDMRLRAAVLFNFLVSSNCQNSTVANCECFRPGMRRVHRVDMAMKQHEIGRLWRLASSQARKERSEKKPNKQPYVIVHLISLKSPSNILLSNRLSTDKQFFDGGEPKKYLLKFVCALVFEKEGAVFLFPSNVFSRARRRNDPPRR